MRVMKSAGEVAVGDWLWWGGETARQVSNIRFGPPKGDETERQVRIWFTDSYTSERGDEGQTVYLATEEEIAAYPKVAPRET